MTPYEIVIEPEYIPREVPSLDGIDIVYLTGEDE